jgi:hypothetical protein
MEMAAVVTPETPLNQLRAVAVDSLIATRFLRPPASA